MSKDLIKEYEELKRKFNHLIYPVQYSAEINLRLERITHLLQVLGNPQKNFHVIHVGGTSGKGSTSTMISQILTTAGYKTGLHTSPYMQILNEGFQINNDITPTKVLLECFDEIKPAVNEVSEVNPYGSPSYFEVKIALALYLFAKAGVDIAIVEVGLGGRLDATNAIDAKIAVITNIGLDHTEILGDTVELIAQDKAGIIKPGQTVISGLSQPSTRQIVADRCAEKKADLLQLDEDFSFYHSEGAEEFTVNLPDQVHSDIRFNLLGDFQFQNAVIAIAAVHAFDKTINTYTIQQGLLLTKIPGRMEIVQKKPTVILDGAHNTDKIRAASKGIERIFPDKKRLVIFALKQGKTYDEILPYVVNGTDIIILTSFKTDLWNAIEPALLQETALKINESITTIVEPDNQKALGLALQLAKQEDLIWVTGSLYLIGNIRDHWYPPESMLKIG